MNFSDDVMWGLGFRRRHYGVRRFARLGAGDHRDAGRRLGSSPFAFIHFMASPALETLLWAHNMNLRRRFIEG